MSAPAAGDIRLALEAAARDYAAGNLAAAEARCRHVATTDPALAVQRDQLLGLVCMGAHRIDEAIAAYRAAFARAPDHAGVCYGMGCALQAAGRHEEAVHPLERAAALAAEHPDAHRALGKSLLAVGRNAAAINSLQRAVTLDPDDPDARNDLGAALLREHRREEAEHCFRRALALDPELGEAAVNLGLVLTARGALEQAERAFEQALMIVPGQPVATQHLAELLLQRKAAGEAVQCCERALAVDPRQTGIRCRLGSAYLAQGRLEDAENQFLQAVSGAPPLAEPHLGLGRVRLRQGRLEEADTALRRALELDPALTDAANNLGVVHALRGRYDEAETLFRGLLAQDPALVPVSLNLANVLYERMRLDEAEAVYRRCIAQAPASSSAHFSLALLLLLQGRHAEAWPEYEWRIAHQFETDYLADPRTPGTILPRPSSLLPRPSSLLPLALTGKRLLVLPDQGLGDELFFLRFARIARARGAWLAYASPPKIASLVERSGAVDRLVRRADEVGELHHVFSVGELPLVLGADACAPPPASLPLMPLPDRVSAARAWLRERGEPPYLALTWRAGTPLTEQRGNRSLFKEMALADLAQALAGCRATLVAVQRLPQPGELEGFSALVGRPVHDASAFNDDLEAMLALLALVDDYVTVSNTNVHLRAGLGRGARVIVPCPPDWRWMREGERSPWFPGMHVYRQAPDEPMSAPLGRLASDLGSA